MFRDSISSYGYRRRNRAFRRMMYRQQRGCCCCIPFVFLMGLGAVQLTGLGAALLSCRSNRPTD